MYESDDGESWTKITREETNIKSLGCVDTDDILGLLDKTKTCAIRTKVCGDMTFLWFVKDYDRGCVLLYTKNARQWGAKLLPFTVGNIVYNPINDITIIQEVNTDSYIMFLENTVQQTSKVVKVDGKVDATSINTKTLTVNGKQYEPLEPKIQQALTMPEETINIASDVNINNGMLETDSKLSTKYKNGMRGITYVGAYSTQNYWDIIYVPYLQQYLVLSSAHVDETNDTKFDITVKAFENITDINT